MNRAIFRESATTRTSGLFLFAMGVLVLVVATAGCAHLPLVSRDGGASGPATIAGQVSSDRGAVIADASITLTGPSVRRHTTTDFTGRYKFEQIPLGTYVVSASAPGYKGAKQHVTADKEGAVKADLKLRM